MTATTACAADVKRYTIKDDAGGFVRSYQDAIKYMGDNHMALRLDGKCASACTLILSTVANLDICVTPNAIFRFHQAYISTPMGPEYTVEAIVSGEKAWREQMLAVYPKWVGALIDKAGGVPSVYTTGKTDVFLEMHFDVLSEYMKVCAN
jgi:hypothetical protein